MLALRPTVKRVKGCLGTALVGRTHLQTVSREAYTGCTTRVYHGCITGCTTRVYLRVYIPGYASQGVYSGVHAGYASPGGYNSGVHAGYASQGV